jgi:hypothetical protein
MGVTRLCAALSNNDTLQTLILDTNSMGDEGAAAIAELLTSTIPHVDIDPFPSFSS